MEVSFTNAKMQKLCNSASKLRGKYGPKQGPLVQQRLVELAAAETLADMVKVVGARCHPLVANLQGLWAVDLIHPDRLVFRPANDPLPMKPDGGLDTAQITEVEVVKIGDYHR